MVLKKFRIISLLFAIVFFCSACDWFLTFLPSHKGDGYWAITDGSMWFYSENNENYARANGMIVRDNCTVAICIVWEVDNSCTVYDDAGNELFIGKTRIRKDDLEKGICHMEIYKWKQEALFQEDSLIFYWQGDSLPE